MKHPLLHVLFICFLLLAGCATTQTGSEREVAIGPYAAFSGRLIVLEPSRRWQVLIDWKADKAEQGWLRVTHAASGTVAEFRWRNSFMEIRDNQHPAWQRIGQPKLEEHGIVIPPAELASILLGRMPAHFASKGPNSWETRKHGRLIRLNWQPEKHKITMSDIAHGRVATLLIQP